jgi:CRISPR-associated endoribonuclease Cas6
LSLVLELQPSSQAMAAMKPWYGKAAQAICLDAVRDAFSKKFSDSMHVPNQLRAYTTSSLFSDSPLNGQISPGSRYFLRFTALNEETTRAFIKATQPGQPLNPCSILNLAGLQMQIQGVHFNSRQHPLAGMTSYETIWDDTLKRAGYLPGQITLMFYAPTFFKSTQTGRLTPFPTATLVFGSLFERWKACTRLEVPDAFKVYAAKSIHHVDDDLQLISVNDGKYERSGAVGSVTYQSKNPGSPYWLFAHILARFAMFAGVGKETASGFGQCQALV